jgi:hypothetical protein
VIDATVNGLWSESRKALEASDTTTTTTTTTTYNYSILAIMNDSLVSALVALIFILSSTAALVHSKVIITKQSFIVPLRSFSLTNTFDQYYAIPDTNTACFFLSLQLRTAAMGDNCPPASRIIFQ